MWFHSSAPVSGKGMLATLGTYGPNTVPIPDTGTTKSTTRTTPATVRYVSGTRSPADPIIVAFTPPPAQKTFKNRRGESGTIFVRSPRSATPFEHKGDNVVSDGAKSEPPVTLDWSDAGTTT